MIPCSCGSSDIELYPMRRLVNGYAERTYIMRCRKCGNMVRGETPKATEWKWNVRMSKKVTTWDVEFNDCVGQHEILKDQSIEDVLDLLTRRYDVITDMKVVKKVKEEI